MSAIYVKQNSVWKEGKPYVKHGGVWKEVTQAWVKQGGVWKETYSASTGLVGWWKMENLNAEIGANLINYTPTIDYLPAKFGNGIWCEDTYYSSGASLSWTYTPKGCIEFWCKPIVSNPYTLLNGDISFFYDAIDGVWKLRLPTDGSDSSEFWFFPFTLTAGVLAHIAIVWDNEYGLYISEGVGENCAVLINGEGVSAAAPLNWGIRNTNKSMVTYLADSGVYDPDRATNVIIDNLKIFDYPKIKFGDIMSENPALVGWWKMDNSFSASRGVNFIVPEGMYYFGPGKFYAGFKFTAGYTWDPEYWKAILPSWTYTPQGCIEFWYVPNHTGVTSDTAFLWNFGVNLKTEQYDSYVHLRIFGEEVIYPFFDTVAGVPMHIAISWDALGNVWDQYDTSVMLYINGSPAPEASQLNIPIPKNEVVISNGWVGFGSDDGSCANGVIDNLKIWNYTKTNFSDRFTENATEPI